MSGCLKRSARLVVASFACLLFASTAQAASFDCGKASSNVEKPICADAKLSKLDEKFAEAYTLLMSKDDELCNHMLELFNQDLEQYGESGDEHQEEHQEFKRVPWQPARFSSVINGHTEYTDVEGALFDFNNDGVQDFVVRWKGSLSNARADSIFILGGEAVSKKNDLTSMEFGDAKDRIYLAGAIYQPTTSPEIAVNPRVLEPFIYRDTSYLFMRGLFEVRRTIAGYAAITKYVGGKFVNRELTGKMEDICYYQRNRANRTH